MNNNKKIVFFASGSGSNFKNAAEFLGKKEQINVSALFSNKPDCGAVQFALSNNIHVEHFSKEELTNNPNVLVNKLKSISPSLIVLSGFLLKIPEEMVKAFPNKIINLHPALLPKFGGKGMYGAHVHQAVYEAKEKETGITIHFVNEHYDEGSIIAQFKTPLTEQDTPESIEQKVRALEQEYFPKTIFNTLSEL